MRNGRPLRALLLDLDDTILDDRAGYEEAWEHAADLLVEGQPGLDRAAVREEADRVSAWWWGDPDRHRRGRLDLAAARGEVLTIVLERLGRPDPERARAAGRALQALRERHQRFLPGAAAALERLRARVPTLALVTNGAEAAQRAKVERFGLERHFDHIQIEGEFGFGKPEPAVFEHVLERLGVPAEDCLMAGDNFEADVLGAQAVGIDAVWMDVRARGRAPAPAPRPFWTVRSLDELARSLS
jgi:putative hydrolase of the HAD superfamily